MVEPGDSVKVWLFQYWFECKDRKPCDFAAPFTDQPKLERWRTKEWKNKGGLGIEFVKYMSINQYKYMDG